MDREVVDQGRRPPHVIHIDKDLSEVHPFGFQGWNPGCLFLMMLTGYPLDRVFGDFAESGY